MTEPEPVAEQTVVPQLPPLTIEQNVGPILESPTPPLPLPGPEAPVAEPVPQPFFASVTKARDAGNWEEMIGGNLLNKLGALVLVIGIALFLSYSLAHMGAVGRAFTGLGVSAAMLAGGLWRERKEEYRMFARGVIAAGWASLYFTSYAMHALPATRVIESPGFGLAFMLAVAAAMVLHSLRYRVPVSHRTGVWLYFRRTRAQRLDHLHNCSAGADRGLASLSGTALPVVRISVVGRGLDLRGISDAPSHGGAIDDHRIHAAVVLGDV